MSEPGGAREPAIARKGPELPACGGDFAEAAGAEEDDDGGGHYRCAGTALRGVVEDLEEGLAGAGVQDAFHVAGREGQGDDHEQAEHGVWGHAPDYGFGEGDGGVFDFLGCGLRKRSATTTANYGVCGAIW